MISYNIIPTRGAGNVIILILHMKKLRHMETGKSLTPNHVVNGQVQFWALGYSVLVTT